jgi:hypothetical protein
VSFLNLRRSGRSRYGKVDFLTIRNDPAGRIRRNNGQSPKHTDKAQQQQNYRRVVSMANHDSRVLSPWCVVKAPGSLDTLRGRRTPCNTVETLKLTTVSFLLRRRSGRSRNVRHESMGHGAYVKTFIVLCPTERTGITKKSSTTTIAFRSGNKGRFRTLHQVNERPPTPVASFMRRESRIKDTTEFLSARSTVNHSAAEPTVDS